MKNSRKRGKFIWLIILLLFWGLSNLALAEELLFQPGRPLTLDQARAIALKFHPSLVASKETVLAYKALVEQALAAYYHR